MRGTKCQALRMLVHLIWPRLQEMLMKGKKCQGTTSVVPQLAFRKTWALAPEGRSFRIDGDLLPTHEKALQTARRPANERFAGATLFPDRVL